MAKRPFRKRLPITRLRSLESSFARDEQRDAVERRIGDFDQPATGRVRLGVQPEAQPIDARRKAEIEVAVAGQALKLAADFSTFEIVDGQLSGRIFEYFDEGSEVDFARRRGERNLRAALAGGQKGKTNGQ